MTQFWSVVLIEIKDIFTKKNPTSFSYRNAKDITCSYLYQFDKKKMFLFEKIRNEKEKKFVGVFVSNSF